MINQGTFIKRGTNSKNAIFQKNEKTFLVGHVRNVMSKFQSYRLKGVAVIAIIGIHTPTHTYCRT